MLNVSLNKFKIINKKKINQSLYHVINSNGEEHIDNLISNFLIEKNSFIFESVEKGKIKGRYTIFGRNPSKIWEFNKGRCFEYNNKLKKKKN